MTFFQKKRLFCPGPTPVPMDSALKSLQSLEVYHRSQDFGRDFLRCREMLAPIMGCKEPPLILTTSGTGAMEALLRHLTDPGDEVVVVEGGKFGERWSQIARAYGLQVNPVVVPWGRDVSAEQLLRVVGEHSRTRAVFLQASETSTGVFYDVAQLSSALRDAFPEVFIAVDAISSLGAHEMCMDEWGLDGVVSGSQKGFGVSPGLSFVALSQRAWQKPQRHPAFYSDLVRERSTQSKGFSAWTPAVSLVAMLKASLEEIHSRGLQQMLLAHRCASQATRTAVQAMGLSCFAKPASYGLTAIRVPAGVDGVELLRHAYEHYGVVFAGGQGRLKGQVVRYAHLGFWDALDLVGGMAALEMSLRDLSYPVASGLAAMAEELRQGRVSSSPSQKDSP